MIGFFSIALLLLYYLAKLESTDVKDHGRYNGVKVYMNDSLITSSSKNYIGNTTNYVFIYDLQSKVTEVYKLDDIKKIEFPEWKGRGYIHRQRALEMEIKKTVKILQPKAAKPDSTKKDSLKK